MSQSACRVGRTCRAKSTNGRRPKLSLFQQKLRQLAVLLLLISTVPGVPLVVADDLPAAKVEAADVPSTLALSLDQLERSLAELEQSENVPVDVKLQAADNYKAAIKNLQSAAASDARLQALIAETASVAERAEQLKKQREELKDKKPTLDANLTLQELEQLLPSTDLQLSTFKKARADAEAELQSRSPRRKEIRERMAVIQEKITDADTQLRSLSTAESTPQSQSLSARLASRRVTLEKEKPALEAELTKFDAEESADLVRLRIELAALNAAYTEKTIAALQERINAGRDAAAARSRPDSSTGSHQRRARSEMLRRTKSRIGRAVEDDR